MRMISYTTKPGMAAENRTLVEGVFSALEESGLPDISYTVLESGDGNFMHVVESTESASKALLALPAFKTFLAGLDDRQSVPNVTTQLRIVGRYGEPIGQ